MQNDIHNKPLDGTPFVPFETAWASLQPVLDKEAARRKKRKRRFIIFWISILAIGVFGTFLLKHNNSNTMPVIAKGKAASMPHTKGVTAAVVLPPITTKVTASKRNEMNLVNGEVHKSSMQSQGKTSNISGYDNTTKAEKAGGNLLPNNNELVLTPASSLALREAAVNSSENSRKKSVSPTLITDTATAAVKTSIHVFGDSSDTKTDTSLSILNPARKQVATSTKKNTSLSFGIRLNAPLQAGINTYNVNIEKKPLSLLVPTVFISKQINKKQSLLLSFNPYAQYYINNKAKLASHSYTIFLQRGSTQNDAPLTYTAIQTLAVNKLMGVEASIMYQYQFTRKWQVGAGIGHLWAQNALLANTITQSDAGITKDSIYGLDKRSSGWSLVKNTVLIGKLEACYTTKKVAIGLDVSVPFDDVANTVISNKKISNKNLFVRWVFK